MFRQIGKLTKVSAECFLPENTQACKAACLCSYLPGLDDRPESPESCLASCGKDGIVVVEGRAESVEPAAGGGLMKLGRRE